MFEKQFIESLKTLYNRGFEDYWMPAVVARKETAAVGRISNGDTVIFCCRRGERETQLMQCFVDPTFPFFPVEKLPDLRFVPLVEYSADFVGKYPEKYPAIEPLIPPIRITNSLGEVLSVHGIRQLAITESEKEAHVTFFFNGRKNALFPGQSSNIIPSWKEFRSHPEMRTREIAEAVTQSMEQYPFLLVNFPAGDVIGHLPEVDLKIKSAEEIDHGLRRILEKARSLKYTLVITADHGLMERGRNEDGTPCIAHTTAPVPLIIVQQGLSPNALQKSRGSLIDIAPTILTLFGIEKPLEMQGNSVLSECQPTKGVVLIILDGWGEAAEDLATVSAKDTSINPLKMAKTPTIDSLKATFPFIKLEASGSAVGLPENRSGNSETGHLTIGAGRRIEQDELRLQKERETDFQENAVLEKTIHGMKRNSSLHLIGLLSEASSHGNIHEMCSIARFAHNRRVLPIYIHCILDGRSTPPKAGIDLLEKHTHSLQDYRLVTLAGRGYALDRSRDYTGKTKRMYDALVSGTGETCRI